MSRGKSIIGVLVLSALVLGVVGAANASAAGLTAVTCEKVSIPKTGEFATEHCETPGPGASEYNTVAIPNGTNVVATGVDPQLSATVALSKIVVTCELSTGTGKVSNKEEGGEMRAHGTETVIDYTGCHARLASKTSAEEQCKVKDVATGTVGTIATKKLTTLTGAEHKVTVKPETGTEFAKFEVLNEKVGTPACSLPKTTVTVSGEVIGIANTEKHSHLTFTTATNGTNLKANGAVANYNGTEVGYMDNGVGQPHGKTVGLTTF